MGGKIMDKKYGSPMVKDGAIGNANRTVAETIVKERSGIRLIETIEYYLNELDRLENKGKVGA
jgi:hypothetical protein